jgi:hypothetical protein
VVSNDDCRFDSDAVLGDAPVSPGADRPEFDVRLEEFRRIARELHDTLLQSFQGVMLRFQIVDNLLPTGKAKEELEVARSGRSGHCGRT